jgi:Holliday junction resolvase RusA-like endonuclease
MVVSFFVHGIPRPGGSKRPVPNRFTGKIAMIDMSKNKPWRDSVASTAIEALVGMKPITGPVWFEVKFYFTRPKGHYGTGKNAETVKPSAPQWPLVPPDLTKLLRSTEDALKDIAWRDDSLVISQMASKHYGDHPGAEITIADQCLEEKTNK